MSDFALLQNIVDGALSAPLAILTHAEGASFMSDLNWSLVIPVLINAAMLAYMLGGLKSDIGGLSNRIEKLETDTEKERDSYKRVDDRINTIAISQAKVEILMSEVRTRVDALCLEASDCPLAQGRLVLRKGRKPVHTEDSQT